MGKAQAQGRRAFHGRDIIEQRKIGKVDRYLGWRQPTLQGRLQLSTNKQRNEGKSKPKR